MEYNTFPNWICSALEHKAERVGYTVKQNDTYVLFGNDGWGACTHHWLLQNTTASTVCPLKESRHLMEDYSVDTQCFGKISSE